MSTSAEAVVITWPAVVMVDPVIAADGYSYEQSAICDWLQHNSTLPVTHVALAHTRLVILSSSRRLLVNSKSSSRSSHSISRGRKPSSSSLNGVQARQLPRSEAEILVQVLAS